VRATVFRGVIQCFLSDPEKTTGHFFGKSIGVFANLETDDDAAVLKDFATKFVEGGTQTQVVELG